MTAATLIWHNLGRNKPRTALTLAAVAVSVFLFVLLRATVQSMRDVADRSARELRLVVHQKSTMTRLLPLGYGPKIAALAGVQAVCGVRWFGGRISSSAEQFPSLAAQCSTLPAVYPDFALRADELQAWRDDRQAAVVGAALAQRLGWTPGTRVTLRGGIPPYPQLEFHVVALNRAAAYPNLFVFRLDYLLDALRTAGAMSSDYNDAVNFYWVKSASAAVLDRVRADIDATFADTPTTTRTEHEEAFVASFTRMFGDIPGIVGAVGLVVLATMLLVIGNTLSMSIRERAAELGILKAIGFPAQRMVAIVLAESTLLGLLGAALGVLPALLIAHPAQHDGLNIPYFPTIAVTPATVLLGIAAGAAVGCLAGAAPARSVIRQPVTASLRNEN